MRMRDGERGVKGGVQPRETYGSEVLFGLPSIRVGASRAAAPDGGGLVADCFAPAPRHRRAGDPLVRPSLVTAMASVRDAEAAGATRKGSRRRRVALRLPRGVVRLRRGDREVGSPSVPTIARGWDGQTQDCPTSAACTPARHVGDDCLTFGSDGAPAGRRLGGAKSGGRDRVTQGGESWLRPGCVACIVLPRSATPSAPSSRAPDTLGELQVLMPREVSSGLIRRVLPGLRAGCPWGLQVAPGSTFSAPTACRAQGRGHRAARPGAEDLLGVVRSGRPSSRMARSV